MKKSSLLSLSLLSLLILSACALLPQAKTSEPNAASSSSSSSSRSSSSSKSRYSRDRSSSSSSYSSSSSSSSSSRSYSRSYNPYTLYNDMGQALDALTDMQDIDKWEAFKAINLVSFEEQSDKVASTKDQVRAQLGQPTEVMEGGSDLWETDKYSIMVGYDDASKASVKLISFKEAPTITDLSGISDSMSPQEIVQKLGRPTIIDVTGMFTRMGWQSSDSKLWTVSYIGDQVYEIKKPS